MRLEAWPLPIALGVVCLAGLGVLEYRRQNQNSSDDALVRRLPSRDTVRFFLNVAELRSANLLDRVAGSRAAEELDYKQFVADTGFDYREDLDAVAGAFTRDTTYLLVRGRFDWQQVRAYGLRHRALCEHGYCSASLATGRKIAFFPLMPGVLAVSIGDSAGAAYAMKEDHDPGGPVPSGLALWFRVAPGSLESRRDLPDGARAFLGALRGSQMITLGLGASGGLIEARLDARCTSPQEAAEVRAQLQNLTDTLRKFLDREKLTPTPTDLSSILVAGNFEAKESAVSGRWPVSFAFLDNFAATESQP